MNDNEKGKGLRFGLIAIAVVVAVLSVAIVIRWYFIGFPAVFKSFLPHPPVVSTPKGSPAEAAEKLRKALNDRLQALGIWKLLEGEAAVQVVTLRGEVFPVCHETFRLPRRFSPYELAALLDPTAVSLGARRVKAPAEEPPSAPDASRTTYSFAYDDKWTPMEITFVETHKPRVCIVVDDGGYQRGEALERLYGFKVPVTLALIPGAEFAKNLAEEAPSQGIEVICHMPMEGHEKFPKGAYPEYLMRGMSQGEVKKNLDAAFDNLPGCQGMNNHMGSLATADAALMSEVCGVLKSRGLFFLDSRTSVQTVGEQEAQKVHLPHFRRDVFLDNVEQPDAILKQLDQLVEKAKKRGFAVGIGHFRLMTLKVLEEAVHKLRDEGIQFVYASEIVKDE